MITSLESRIASLTTNQERNRQALADAKSVAAKRYLSPAERVRAEENVASWTRHVARVDAILAERIAERDADATTTTYPFRASVSTCYDGCTEELHTDAFAAYEDATGSVRDMGYEVRSMVIDPAGSVAYEGEVWHDGMLIGYARVEAGAFTV